MSWTGRYLMFTIAVSAALFCYLVIPKMVQSAHTRELQRAQDQAELRAAEEEACEARDFPTRRCADILCGTAYNQRQDSPCYVLYYGRFKSE